MGFFLTLGLSHQGPASASFYRSLTIKRFTAASILLAAVFILVGRPRAIYDVIIRKCNDADTIIDGFEHESIVSQTWSNRIDEFYQLGKPQKLFGEKSWHLIVVYSSKSAPNPRFYF